MSSSSVVAPQAPACVSVQAIAERYLANFPDLHRLARQGAGHLLQAQLGHWCDPDTIWWHRFDTAQSSSRTFTGWEHSGQPRESVTLTHLLVRRFTLREQFNFDLLGQCGGFYRSPAGPGHYDERNEVRLMPDRVLDALWSMDFRSVYRKAFEAFWWQHASDFCVLARARFLAAVTQARADQRLTADERYQLLNAAFGALQLPTHLQRLGQDRDSRVRSGFRTFEVGGLQARGVLRMQFGNGRQVLYVVGAEAALYTFRDHLDLYNWVLALVREEEGRERFSGWFLDAGNYRQVQGICTQLRAHELQLNSKAEAIRGDVFVYLREQVKAALSRDAHAQIVSNSELSKSQWLVYLGEAAGLATPAAPLGWPLALLGIGAGVGSLALHLDQALNGRTTAWRQAGWWGVLLDTLFVLLDAYMMRAGELLEVPLQKLDRRTLQVTRQPASAPSALLDELAPTLETAGSGRLERRSSSFWDLHMQAGVDRLHAASDLALVRQRLLLADVPRVDAQMLSASGQYLDAFGQPLAVYCDELGFGARNIKQYSHSPQRYNDLLRGLPLEDGVAPSVARVHALCDELGQLGADNQVRLYRVGLAERGTSGAYWRDGRITVGDRLLTTDFTSFSENPYVAWEMFHNPQVLAAGHVVFGEDAVVYVLEPGGARCAVPVAPFSDLPHEAESLLMPGWALRVEAVAEVSGAQYRFTQVRLKALEAGSGGGALFELRSGAPVVRQALAQRVGESLMERLFREV
ncbi:dermonecrotic toxin domain-containing protein [Pseudomonas sp. SDI]|uniref:dermonecrotic toxin domain-containing protein n=1 Tax=Pseudomonas sp. SDI TaxID=2170734 RepID=UPI001057AA67|nr:DUF6543 domain-containing protein [Pseudomonas sp. SDI]